MVKILQLVHEISSFPEVFYKIGDLKNFSKLQVNKRSSHSEVFCKKEVLKNFAKFTEKRLWWSPFFNKSGNLKILEAATGDAL